LPRGDRYTSVAIAIHWTIAALVLTNILLGLLHDGAPKPVGAQMMWWHKSLGISVMLLTLFRLFWRVAHRPPPLPAEMPRWEVWAARATHWAFYAVLIGLPLTGWVFSSASLRNAPIPFFGLEWPYLPVHSLDEVRRKALTSTWHNYHEKLAWVAYALLAVHVAAALKHWLFNKDNVMRHMIPALKERRPVVKVPGKTAV
jgi:cytochrome b561